MNRYLLLLLLATGISSTWGQDFTIPAQSRGSSVIDDSTKQIYGPETMEIFQEEKLRFNLATKVTIDTSEYNFHKQFYDMEIADYEAQDLGNMGTAWRDFYYQAPSQIGASSGYNVFNKYYQPTDDITLFDTKSPYSYISALWGGEGRSVTRVGYTRNIHKNWNFGFNYRSYLIDKQVGKERRGDRNTSSTNINLYSWYRSENNKYTLLGILSGMNHTVTEMGGVDVPDGATALDYFLDTNRPLLSSVDNIDKRRELYVFHRYELDELLSVFHRLRWGSQENEFTMGSSVDSDYFDFMLMEFETDLSDVSKFKDLTNQVGLSGYTRGFQYDVYLKARNLNMDYKYLPAEGLNLEPKRFEQYAGINLQTTIDSTFHINGNAEILAGGNFRLHGTIRSNFLEGEATQVKYEPSFIQNGYQGHFNYWFNDFVPVQSTTLRGKLKLNKNSFSFAPEMGLINVTNPIYFRERTGLGEQISLPIQNPDAANLLWVGAEGAFTTKSFYLKLKAKANRVGGGAAESMPIPELLANSDIGITTILFDNNLRLQVGAKVHWQSSFIGMGYDPGIQQFYVQEDFAIPDYFLFSAYLNARIDKGTLFLKMNNIGKIFNDIGYFTTPEYPGINAILDFGFNWKFYD